MIRDCLHGLCLKPQVKMMQVAFVNELQSTGLYCDYEEIRFILHKKLYKASKAAQFWYH